MGHIKRIGIVAKRYPRLSETFVINDLRGLEWHGHELEIFSLLPCEPGPHHKMVEDVRASVTYPHAGWPFWSELGRAHLTVVMRHPLRYLWALVACLKHFYRFAGWKNFFRGGILAKWAWDRGITHFHAHFAHGPASVVYFAHLMTGLPYSISGHAKDLYLTSPKALRRRLRRARFMVTCTAGNVTHLKQIAPQYQEKVHLVRHGIDLKEFDGALRTPDPGQVPIFLSVGRLVEKKGYPDLFTAYRLLKDRGIPFRAVIIGSGPQSLVLRQKVTDLDLESAVVFLGSLSHEDLIPFYHQATLFVLAPHVLESGDRDGVPNVLLEAMACRLPIVTTRTSGIPEVLAHQQQALLTEPRNPEDLADTLQYALEHPEVMSKLAEAAYRLAEARFDFRQSTKLFSDLLWGMDGMTSPTSVGQGVVL